MLGHGDDKSIGSTILKHHPRQLEHVSRMSSQQLSLRASFANYEADWKKWRDGRFIA